MAMVEADWTIDRATGNIRYVGDDHLRFGGTTPSYATVIEFHRWIQAYADDAEYVPATNDEHDIIDRTATERSTDNIITLNDYSGGGGVTYNIDATAAEHLYDGSIIQNGGAEIYDGIVNFGNSDVVVQIIQDGAVLSDDWWNLSAGGGLNADAAQGISHRFMLRIRTAGADVDGRRLIGTNRTFGNTYGEFKINGTSRGNNVLALSDVNDINNNTAEATVATWTTITNTTEGFVQLDVNNDGSTEDYYSEWNRAAFTINQFYERMKWLTRDGSVSTLYGLNGELFRGITHELDVDGGAGTFGTPEHESISWGSGATAGTARLLAVDNKAGASTTKIWFQLLTGVTPADNLTITGGTSGATVLADLTTGALVERAISTPFVGQSTGTALIGSYGLSLETTDLAASDTVFDLTNTQRTPPNTVTFTVSGLVVSEDYVLVTNSSAGQIDFTQMAGDTSLVGAAETSVSINPAPGIPVDCPATGTIRIERDSGLYSRHPFSARDVGTDTFTITSANFSTDNATAPFNVFITYLDKLATTTDETFSYVYNADRTHFVRVRDGGGSPIKTAETTGTMGTGGGSATINRISDV